MTKVLFVTLHRPGRSASQRLRFEQYIPFLELHGFKCKHSFILNANDDKIFYSKGKVFKKGLLVLKAILIRIIDVIFKKADIIFIQRESFMLGTSLFEKLFSKKGKVIYDFDDSIWIKQVSEGNKPFAILKNADKIKEIIKISDLIIAGNNFLASYALKYSNNIIVIPTTIDTELYIPKNKHTYGPICIGWIGSVSTIAHFKMIIPVLKRLAEVYKEKISFKVIGSDEFSCSDLKIKGIAWSLESELTELRKIDIGIMPIPSDEWGEGKCGLKGLQYMSLAIATIMSDVGVNKEIIEDGENGFLANTEEDWFKKLSILIDNPVLRSAIGIKGRETIIEKYSVNSNKEKYLKAFSSLQV